MAVTNTPEASRRLNRKERRTNLANNRKEMRKFKRNRGPSVAPPLIGNVVDPGHETELTEAARNE